MVHHVVNLPVRPRHSRGLTHRQGNAFIIKHNSQVILSVRWESRIRSKSNKDNQANVEGLEVLPG